MWQILLGIVAAFFIGMIGYFFYDKRRNKKLREHLAKKVVFKE